MAKIMQVNKRNPRRKKWEHFKLKFRIFLFRTSVLVNLATLIYLANEQGYLTNIIARLNPILEGLIKQLPL